MADYWTGAQVMSGAFLDSIVQIAHDMELATTRLAYSWAGQYPSRTFGEAVLFVLLILGEMRRLS